MTLVCAFCLYARDGAAEEAVTVLEGRAVCEEHLPWVKWTAFAGACEDIRRVEAW